MTKRDPRDEPTVAIPPEDTEDTMDTRPTSRSLFGDVAAGTPEAVGANELDARYKVGAPIGSGGMGDVFVGLDRRLERKVAIKVSRRLGAESPELRRFLREARITSQLEHPNIPPVHDLGVGGDGCVYFTMKRVRGKTLSALIREESLSLTEKIEVFTKVCDAMAYAHSRKVIHRDLKPANVMVGSYGRVYVLDWGIAKVLEDGPREAVPADADAALTTAGDQATAEGQILGTLAYMSPEQALGGTETLDGRSDIYSLGVMLYRLLVGQSPYPDNRLIRHIARGNLVPPRSVDRGVPWELEAIVLKAMALHPENRYPTATALREDLQRFLEQEPVQAVRYSVLARAQKGLWRHRRIVGAVSLTAGLSAALLIVSLLIYVNSVMLARDRAVRAERESEGRLADSMVALARARAEDGEVGEALADLDEATGHYLAAGLDPLAAELQRSWLYGQIPPPLVEWHSAERILTAGMSPAGDLLSLKMDILGLYDPGTGALLNRVIPANHHWTGWQQGQIATVSVSENGVYEARTAPGGALLWRVETGVGSWQDRRLLVAEDAPVFAHSQREFGTQVWDTSTGQMLFDPIPGTFGFSMSADGRWLCVLYSEEMLRAATGLAVLDGRTGEVAYPTEAQSCGLFSRDGRLYVEDIDDGYAVVEMPGGERLWSQQGSGRRRFSSDGAVLVSVGVDGKAERRDARTGELLGQRRIFGAPNTSLGSILVPGDGTAVVTVMGRHARSWGLAAQLASRSMRTDDHLTGMDLSPTGELLATVGFDGEVRVWHWRTGSLLWQRPVSEQGLRDVLFAEDGRSLLVADREGVATRFDLLDRREPVRYGEAGPQIAMAAVEVGDRVLVAMDDGRLVVWDRDSGNRLRQITTELNSVWSLSIDSTRNRLAVSGRNHEDPIGAILDLDSEEMIWTPPEDYHAAYRTAVGPDGTVGFASHNGRPLLVAPDLKSMQWLPDHAEAVQALAFSPDGALLALGDYSGAIVLQRRADGREMLRFQESRRSVVDMAFTADGSALVAVAGDGQVIRVDLTLAATLDRARVRVDIDTGTMRRAPTPMEQARAAAATGQWEQAWGLLNQAAETGQEVPALELARVAWATMRRGEATSALDRAVLEADEAGRGELEVWRYLIREQD